MTLHLKALTKLFEYIRDVSKGYIFLFADFIVLFVEQLHETVREDYIFVLFLVFFIEGCFGWPSDDFYVV